MFRDSEGDFEPPLIAEFDPALPDIFEGVEVVPAGGVGAVDEGSKLRDTLFRYLAGGRFVAVVGFAEEGGRDEFFTLGVGSSEDRAGGTGSGGGEGVEVGAGVASWGVAEGAGRVVEPGGGSAAGKPGRLVEGYVFHT